MSNAAIGKPARFASAALSFLFCIIASQCLFGANDTWVSRGPYGGSILAIEINPQNPDIIFAGTSGGGIFKSTNGGSNWNPIFLAGNLMADTIVCIAIDPQDMSVVYAATGSGVFKSTNAGSGWSSASTGLTSPLIYSVAVDPQNSSKLFASTAGGGIFRSTNAGAGWSAANTGLTNPNVFTVAINRQNTSVVYAGTDGNGVFKSTDGGGSWRAMNINLTSRRVYVLRIDPQAPDTVYAATNDGGVFKSTDGAANWSPANNGLTNLNISAMAIDPLNPATLFAESWGGGIFRSADGGESWSAVNAGLTRTEFRALAIDPLNPAVVYAGADGAGIFKSYNGGASWNPTNNGIAYLDIMSLALDPEDPDNLYAGAAPGGVARSTDGGRSWISSRTELTDFDVNALAINPGNPALLYAGTRGGGVFKSTDRSVSWSAASSGLTNPDIRVLKIDPQSTRVLYAGTKGGGVFKSIDGGASWSAANAMLTNLNVYALAINPLSPATVYAGTAGAGVFKSTNGGVNWSASSSGLTNFNVLALAIDPQTPEILYAGTYGGGIFKSTDAGANWNSESTGLTTLNIYSIAIDPETPATLYAGTAGAGFFKSMDEGGNWAAVNEGLTNRYVGTIAVDPLNPATIYAGTAIGVFKLTVNIEVTIGTNPSGLRFTVDGAEYTSAQVFSWTKGSTHTVGTISGQETPGARHTFARWSDGGGLSHTITTLAGLSSIAANFSSRYRLTAIPSPDSGGSIAVNPVAADGYYASGSPVQLTAAANSGYRFTEWSGGAGGTRNPQTITMAAPMSVTALFAPESSTVLTLAAGGAATYETPGRESPLRTGYAKLTTVSGSTPYGIGVFSLSQNGAIISEAGIPASPPTTHARIFIDYRKGAHSIPARSEAGLIDINTGIAVVNYASETANVSYALNDISGQRIATGHGTINAGGYFACFIDELQSRAPDFDFPEDFAASIQFGSLEITSTQPLSVLGLRGTMNQRNEYLMTTTPVADLARAPQTGPTYFPQFVDGGGYTTSLVLMNTSDIPETGTIELRDGAGRPLVVNQVGGMAGDSFAYAIPPGGVYRFQADGSPAGVKAGWVRLTPDAATSTPVGSGVFGYNPDSVLVSESGIPSASSTTHARIYLDLSRGHNTGLALANLSDAGAEISINAFETDGATGVGDSLPIPLEPNGYAAAFADQFVTGLPAEFKGVLDITSATPFAALTLRTLMNERHEFLMTTFPVADLLTAAPSPVVFPQVVDGGGYMTEFILIGAQQAAGTVLNFYGGNGAPLILGAN